MGGGRRIINDDDDDDDGDGLEKKKEFHVFEFQWAHGEKGYLHLFIISRM